jgi:hypothetical protein
MIGDVSYSTEDAAAAAEPLLAAWPRDDAVLTPDHGF